MRSRADLLVLGGTGPIGRALVRAAGDRSVVAVGRRGPQGVDLGDPDAVGVRVRRTRPRAVVYLVRDLVADSDRDDDMLVAALRAAGRADVERFVFASSAAVYGDAGTSPYSEASSLDGTSAYAVTKIRSERRVASSVSLGGPTSLSLRIFNVFGPGCDDGLVNRLVAGPPPALQLTDRFVRDYVHVDDVAAAFLAAVDHPALAGAINVGRGRGVDNLQLAAAARPGSFDAVPAAPTASYSVADVSRSTHALGWTATVDPLDALRRDRLD